VKIGIIYVSFNHEFLGHEAYGRHKKGAFKPLNKTTKLITTIQAFALGFRYKDLSF